MGFVGQKFSFNHISCRKYGLLIYDVDGNSNSAAPFASTGKLLSDTVTSTGRTYLYGRSFDKPLQFSLVFGLDPELYIDMNEYLDRYEMAAIANWLTGPTTYKWLEIEQPDMEMIRYNCIISDLQPIELSWIPWGFTAKVMCDSPYAYLRPAKFEYTCTGNQTIKLYSQSTIDQWYYPPLSITPTGSATISLINTSCDNATLKFSGLPFSSNVTIKVDNERKIITSSDSSYNNLYQYCNFDWLPLRRGVNNIQVSGKCKLKFVCQFPINAGG